MTSPSEGGVETVVDSEAPVKLWGSELRVGRDVSRLEFYPVQSRNESTADAKMSCGEGETELRLNEEITALDLRLRSQAEQAAAQLEEARREARAEARREWEEELEAQVEKERALILRTADQFEGERSRYFAAVEAEVVKLALAVAARVLHREAKMDPLLLTAAVRVALEKVAEGSVTVLRVPAAEIETWHGIFTSEAESTAQLVGDERMQSGECVLETSVGRVELGVSAQLAEIEKGFFDLLQQRPA